MNTTRRLCSCQRAKPGLIGYRIDPQCPEHGILTRGIRVDDVAALRMVSMAAAAYAIDRARQYEGGNSALEELSRDLAKLEHWKAYEHGELDDILAEVHWEIPQ